MNINGRVLIVEGDRDSSRCPRVPLSGEAFEEVRARTTDEALALAQSHPPDVVVVAAGPGPEGGRIALRLRASPATRDLPILLLDQGSPGEGGEASAAAVDGLLARGSSADEIEARLATLVRLSTMREEALRRARTARRYGVTSVPAIEPAVELSNIRVILVGGERDDLAEIGAALGESARLEYSESAHDALARLSRQEFDLVVIDAAGQPTGALELCGDVRNNPSLYDLPILLATGDDDFHDPAEPYRRGATEVVSRAARREDLQARVASLVKQQRYRRAMRESYRAALHLATSDSLTGLYTHGFLHEHLGSVIADAKASGKTVGLAAVTIRDMALINGNLGYAVGDHLLRQVGRLLGRLVRGEDLAARLSGTCFCVVLPATGPEACGVALDRIAGVIDCTEFERPDTSESILVKLLVGRAQLEPGDSTEDLIDRALRDLRQRQRQARRD